MKFYYRKFGCRYGDYPDNALSLPLDPELNRNDLQIVAKALDRAINVE